MPYNNDNFRRIAEEFQAKRLKAENDADNRRLQAELAVPELRDIHRQLEATGLEILDAALSGGDISAKFNEIKSRKDALRQRKRQLLLDAEFPEDFTDVRYECSICDDTGYASGKMCKCMKEALVMAGIESSGLGQLVRTQSFDSFSLDFYSGKDQENAKRYRDTLKAFAENFTGDADKSWLLMGATGLGKTHLSSSVAMTVIKRGHDVVYTTTSELFSVFEKQRFGDGQPGDGTDSHFFETDLLIIDDLGTEITNQFTISCLYNVINARLISGRSTIINTNLEPDELRRRYTDRITSRILGEYIPLPFKGHDIRLQKLRML